VRRICPGARIVLGCNYATLCTEHARRLGADSVVVGSDLEPLWRLLQMAPDAEQPALWEVYDLLRVGAIKLSDGCPFRCSYCSVPRVYAGFQPRRCRMR
jgi:tRNA A37 methylthiotransferase MiaB